MEKKTKYIDSAFAVFFVSVTALLIWKAPHGFHFFDEAVWIGTPYRFIQGDVFMVDDWSVLQVPLLLLYPILKLYFAIFPGTEGIILFFRYVFVFFHCGNTLLLYGLIRRKSPLAALCVTMLYFPYSHLYIGALSYYTMPLDLLLLGCAILVSFRKERELLAAGAVFALAVLECPYFVGMYMAYLLASVLCAVLKKRPHRLLTWRSFGLFTAGCAVPAAIVLVFFLSQAKLSDFIRVLPYMFQDRVTEIEGKDSFAGSFFPSVIKNLSIPEILALVTAAVFLADAKREKRKKVYTAVLLAVTAASVFCNFLRSRSGTVARIIVNHSTTLTVSGAAAYLMCGKKNRELLYLLYLPGWVLAFCIFCASDTGYAVAATPLMICACAGAWFLLELTGESFESGDTGRTAKLCLALLFAAVMLMQTGYELWYRKNYCFSEPVGSSMLYSEIGYGIGKGEKTSEQAAVYEQDGLYAATEKVRNAPGEYVLYFSDDCWPYLEDSKKCAAPVQWIHTKTDEAEAERLLIYWEIFPEKKPDAIYVSKNAAHAEKILKIVNTENFPVEENERGYEMVRPR